HRRADTPRASARAPVDGLSSSRTGRTAVAGAPPPRSGAPQGPRRARSGGAGCGAFHVLLLIVWPDEAGAPARRPRSRPRRLKCSRALALAEPEGPERCAHRPRPCGTLRGTLRCGSREFHLFKFLRSGGGGGGIETRGEGGGRETTGAE